MAISGTTAFPFRITPLNNIQPFTYTTGMSHMALLEKLRVYVNDTLRVEFDAGLSYLLDEMERGIANAEAVVLEAKDGWELVFSNYMLDVNASLMALNDHAMATLIDDPATETGTALVNGFIQRTPARTVYVDPVNGDDDAPGEVDSPLATVSEAIRLAERDAQTAATDWVIQLVAGTYTERVTASAYTPFALNITIQGPEVGHPGVPTAVFTEAATGVSAAAFKFENPMATYTVKWVKFVGYNGTSSSAGINSAQGRLFTVNVHATNCFYGVSSTRGQIDVKGGVFDNCGRTNLGTGNGSCVRSLMLNRHSIGVQGAGNLSNGPVFKNSRYGVYAQESSTGHVDWCTFTDNESAIVLRVNSRANIDGSAFERNLTDVQADSNSHVFVPDTVVFGTGINKSGQTIWLTSGSQSTTTRDIAGTAAGYSRGESAVWGEYDVQTVTGTTATVFVLDHSLLAPWWGDNIRIGGTSPKRVRVRAAGTLTGTAGTSQLVLKYGDKTSAVTFSATEEGSFTYEGYVIFPEPGRQIIVSEATRHLATAVRNNVSTTAQDVTIDQRLTLGVVLANAADTVTFEYVELSQG